MNYWGQRGQPSPLWGLGLGPLQGPLDNTTPYGRGSLFTYDVSTVEKAGRRRLRRVAQACEDYGVRVQKSVFECQVGKMEWVSLRDRLLREIKENNREFDLVCEVVGLQLLLMNVLAPMARGERITAEQFQGIVKSVQTAKVKAAGEMLSRRHQPKEA